ncbi:MAG: FG-GAP repeat protein, partial [Alcanivoracaceae bacterium]|nr:FG-GAP repeat protein [Alcanivoracaceae bacterium]
MKKYLYVFTIILVFQAIAKDGLELQRPDNINDKKWASLKTVVQEVKLLPPAGGGVDHNFGNSVSVDGNRMIVGAPNYSLNTIAHGAVYV